MFKIEVPVILIHNELEYFTQKEYLQYLLIDDIMHYSFSPFGKQYFDFMVALVDPDDPEYIKPY